MPLAGVSIGNAQIPVMLDQTVSFPGGYTSDSASRLPRMRYVARDSGRDKIPSFNTAPSLSRDPEPSPSQALTQSRYAARSGRPPQTLAEFRTLLRRIDYYNHPLMDLGIFGSKLRTREEMIERVLSADQLFELPCQLRDARRDVANTISGLENGKQKPAGQCDFLQTARLLNRLDELQPPLPTFSDRIKTSGEDGDKADASRMDSDQSRSAASSISLPDSLSSCDLPLYLIDRHGLDSPPSESPFPTPQALPDIPAVIRHINANSGAHLFARASPVAKYHQQRMAQIAACKSSLQLQLAAYAQSTGGTDSKTSGNTFR